MIASGGCEEEYKCTSASCSDLNLSSAMAGDLFFSILDCTRRINFYHPLPTEGMSINLLRNAARVVCAKSSLSRVPVASVSSRIQQRGYATKNKPKSTSSFVPGSKQPIADPAAQQEYAKAETAMSTSVDWFRKECAASEARAAGRVTPALLSPVRVKLPDDPRPMKLEELATVGVREGSTLLITLFDEHVSMSKPRKPFTAHLHSVDRKTRRSCSL